MPWLWIRHQIAQRWFCTPMYVDWVLEEAPSEVALELQLMRIENAARKAAEG